MSTLEVVCSSYKFSGDSSKMVSEFVCCSWSMVEGYWVIRDKALLAFASSNAGDTWLFKQVLVISVANRVIRVSEDMYSTKFKVAMITFNDGVVNVGV